MVHFYGWGSTSSRLVPLRGGTLWVISTSFVYTGRLIRVFPHLKTLNLTYWSKCSLLLAFCFLFNCMINLTQICMTPWNSSNGKMDDILPLELLQGIIRNIERPKEGTLLLGEGHKLEGNLVLKEGPQTPLYTITPIEVQLGLGTQPRY